MPNTQVVVFTHTNTNSVSRYREMLLSISSPSPTRLRKWTHCEGDLIGFAKNALYKSGELLQAVGVLLTKLQWNQVLIYCDQSKADCLL